MSTSPNVLFILSDQHHAGFMGHTGHPSVQTPHLDRLAAEGTRFTSAVCANPICTPSRVSFLSGQYAHNHGYYGLEGPHPGGLPSLPGIFRAAGYRTGAIGKIHAPEYWVEDGCDVFMDSTGNSIDGVAPRRLQYVKERQLQSHPYAEVSHDGCADLQSYRDSQEGWIAQESKEFMRQSNREGRPFFLHASFPKPHQPYTPSPEFWEMYPEGTFTLPPNHSYDLRAANKSPHLIFESERHQNRTNWYVEPKTYAAAARRKLRGYLGCVSQMDHAVGELLRFLDDEGLSDTTIVVYSSDHGDYACEHGLMEKAPGICSAAVTGIPFIWRAPGRIRAGQVVRETVESVDTAATLCALAGVDAPPTLDGRDISSVLAGESADGQRVGVTEFPFSKSLRWGQHRLVYYPMWFFSEEYPEGFGELYDLSADPWEMRNLWFDRAHREFRDSLKMRLLDWLVSTTRPRTVLPAVRRVGTGWTTRYSNAFAADGKVPPDLFRQVSMMERLRL